MAAALRGWRIWVLYGSRWKLCAWYDALTCVVFLQHVERKILNSSVSRAEGIQNLNPVRGRPIFLARSWLTLPVCWKFSYRAFIVSVIGPFVTLKFSWKLCLGLTILWLIGNILIRELSVDLTNIPFFYQLCVWAPQISIIVSKHKMDKCESAFIQSFRGSLVAPSVVKFWN